MADGRLHQAGAESDDPRRVVERERPGGVRRGDFTEAVTGDRIGLDSPGSPQSRQSDLQCEDRRLCVARLVEPRVAGVGLQFLGDRPTEERPQNSIAFTERVTKHRLAERQPTAHSDPLRPLPAEDEDAASPTARRPPTHEQAGQRLAARERIETRNGLGMRPRQEGDAVLVVGPTGRCGVSEVGQGGRVVRDQSIAMQAGKFP